MRLVGHQDLGFVLVLVIERDLYVLRVRDHVKVGEDVAVFIQDETGTLALLRDRAIKEVEGDHAGGDIHDRGKRFFIDRDVVLLAGKSAGAAWASVISMPPGKGPLFCEEDVLAARVNHPWPPLV